MKTQHIGHRTMTLKEKFISIKNQQESEMMQYACNSVLLSQENHMFNPALAA